MAIFVLFLGVGVVVVVFWGEEVIGKSFKFWKDSATMAIDHYETLFFLKKETHHSLHCSISM